MGAIPGLGVVIGTIFGVILSKYDLATLIALALILIALWFYSKGLRTMRILK